MNSPDLIRSPLNCEFTRDGISVYVSIYRAPEAATWTLEIEHPDGYTVWGDRFPTDEEALSELMLVIEFDGIGTVLSEPHVTSSQWLGSTQ